MVNVNIELFIRYNQLKTYHNCVELLLDKHTILSKSYLEYKLISTANKQTILVV